MTYSISSSTRLLVADFGFTAAYSKESLERGRKRSEARHNTTREGIRPRYLRYTAETKFKIRTEKIEKAPIAPKSTKKKMIW